MSQCQVQGKGKTPLTGPSIWFYISSAHFSPLQFVDTLVWSCIDHQSFCTMLGRHLRPLTEGSAFGRAGRDKTGRKPRPDEGLRQPNKETTREGKAKASRRPWPPHQGRAKPSSSQGKEASTKCKRCPETSPKTRALTKASKAGTNRG